MIHALEFEESTHTYRVGSKVVPSVTQVLEPLQMLHGVSAEVLKAAREFGTHVHQACHLHNIGELDEDALDPALAPYLADWKQFLFDTKFVVAASEERVWHPLYKYAGTADVFGDWKGTTWVVDLKSGVVPVTVGAQLSAYQQAREPRPRRRLCLQLTGHGYKVHEQKELSDFSLFTSALNVFNFLNRRKSHHVEEPSRIADSAA